jgi:hypothetical protein
MQYFAPLLFILSILPTPAVPRNAEFISPGRTLNGADRASAAIGIRRRDGSSGSGRRGSSKVRLAGIRG